MRPSQIKKLVARAERSNEPSTTAQTQTDDTTEIPPTEILGRIFIDPSKEENSANPKAENFAALAPMA